ncbi:MAG: hypothetical protein KAS32_07690 [Candidatus Peribacteraceae bacterium]|nr:hypothetical protein [Candidatus Peribacteraceae bacterium]
MLEDLKKLESLDGKPPGAIEKPASALPAPMGLNSAVIKPETRINKTEDAEQPIKTGCAIPVDQPNQNLMIITEIEGLMSEVNERLDEIIITDKIPGDSVRKLRKSQALEEIDLFQKTTLFDLRKDFE